MKIRASQLSPLESAREERFLAALAEVLRKKGELLPPGMSKSAMVNELRSIVPAARGFGITTALGVARFAFLALLLGQHAQLPYSSEDAPYLREDSLSEETKLRQLLAYTLRLLADEETDAA